MDIEEKIKKIKKDYILIRPREGFLAQAWFDLKEELDAKPKPVFMFRPVLARGLVFSSILALVLGGAFFSVAWAAQRAIPGDRLYPIKRISENLIFKISGNEESLIDRRGQEVIDLYKGKKDSDLLEKAISDYEKAVLEAQEEVEEKGERQGFRQILEKQEAKFKEIIENNPSSKDNLEKAIEASKKGRVENDQVQGVREEDQRGKGRGMEKEKERENSPGPNPGRR